MALLHSDVGESAAENEEFSLIKPDSDKWAMIRQKHLVDWMSNIVNMSLEEHREMRRREVKTTFEMRFKAFFFFSAVSSSIESNASVWQPKFFDAGIKACPPIAVPGFLTTDRFKPLKLEKFACKSHTNLEAISANVPPRSAGNHRHCRIAVWNDSIWTETVT